jgi:hypothetical protein
MRAAGRCWDDEGMLGKHKKVLKSGAQAQAVVLESDMGGLSNSHGANRWKLRLRVQFDDGTTSEVTCHAYSYIGYGVGTILPVRYDPSDRSKVEVDTDSIKAGAKDRLEASRAQLIASAEAQLQHDKG